MRSFPITNGVQCTNAYRQIHYIHTFLNRNVKHTGRPNVKIGVYIQANFSKTTERKENATYRDSSTAQVEFKSRNRSKIGSLYDEIFQYKGTVPNDQNDPFRVLFLYYNQKPLVITTSKKYMGTIPIIGAI